MLKLILLFCVPIWATSVISMGEAESEKLRLRMDTSKKAQSLGVFVRHNLSYYPHLFEWVDDNFHFRIYIQQTGLQIHVRVIHQFSGNNVLERSYSIKNNKRKFAQQISQDIFRGLKGKEGIFDSKIIAVKSFGRSKELVMLDFDGKNEKRLTYHNSIVISPALSPDRSKVVYSMIPGKNPRKVELWIRDLKKRRARILFRKGGINSGGVFTPDGKQVIFTSSIRRNVDLYAYHIQNNKLERITTHYGDDVDPSLSNDGRLLFLSTRPGKATIYLMDRSIGRKSIKRLSFVGKFNATPRFSPNGKEFVFSSWLDNRFDLFRMKSDGSQLVRLTRNFGSNESPSYSSDGELIVFSSQRVLSQNNAVHHLYIIDREGYRLKAITTGNAMYTSPRWSK